MSQSLPRLLPQPSPLYDVPVSTLTVVAAFPSVRNPSLHPETSNRCPRDLERAPCSHLCGAAEEQGELSWPAMLIHQHTSPFRLASTFRFSWRLVIQDFFGARHVARLSSGQMCWQGGDSGPLPFNTDIHCSNQAMSVFIYDKKEGPPQTLEAAPLHRPYYRKWRHVCPQGTSSAHHVATLAGLLTCTGNPTASAGV